MKRLLLLPFLFIFFSSTPVAASHITGGEMFYTLKTAGNNVMEYSVTLRLLQRCNSGRQFPDPTIVSVFDKMTGNRITDLTVRLSETKNIL